MANIDNLNFKVIIDDKEFNKQIKTMEDEAKRFNTSMSNLLNIKKASQQWSQKDVDNNRRAWQAKVDEGRAQEKINREKVKTDGLQRKINAQIEAATQGYKSQSRVLQDLKNMALGYFSVHGASQLLSSLVRVTGEFELQKTTLAAMLGDLNSAEKVITKIQGLAVESPFQFKELTTYAKQLSAFSVPAEELYNTTKMLADISAGLGVGMDRIVLAYGQVRSAAFLRGQEVRQFTEAGIPILDELAKQFTELEGRVVSTTEVIDKISSRLVPFEMVAKVFKEMTSEGGKFYNMQEVQAETLKGKISNLKDAYEVMLNEIGKGQSENIKGAVDFARKMMQNYEDIGKTIKECVITFGLLRTAIITTAVATGTLNAANTAVARGLLSIVKFAANNPYTLLAAGLTAAGIGIYKWATSLTEGEKILKSVDKTTNKYYKSLATESSKLESLYSRFKLAEKGTKEYGEARKQIYTQYASYISQLNAEKKDVSDLIGIYDDLKKKIEEAQKAKFREIASQDIEQTYGESTSKLLDQTEKKIKHLGKDLGMSFSEMETQAIIAYATGSLSEEDIKKNPELNRIGEVMAKPIFQAVRNIRAAFQEATDAYTNGLSAIDKLYATNNQQPFIYNLYGDGESEAQKRIENQIKTIQKLQDAYEKLLPFLNEVQMKSTLKSLFPNVKTSIIDSLDFTAELERLAGELERFNKDAAKSLRDTISKDVAGEMADSFKAVEEYRKALDAWKGQDFNLSGKGIAFDISKIISKLQTEYAQIDEKRKRNLELLHKAQLGDEESLKKVREVYGEEFWKEYLEKGKDVIDELAQKEKDASRDVAEEKIRDLANKYVKEKLSDLDLSDWSDKTIKQIKEIKNEIDRLSEEGVVIDDKTLENIKKAGLTLEEFTQLVAKGFDDAGEIAEEELKKKIVASAKDAAKMISDLGDEISNLGKTIGDSDLEKFGSSLSELSKRAPSLIEALQAKDTVAIIANLASLIVTSLVEPITAAAEQQNMLNEAAREYAQIINDTRRDAYSGIFGTDEIGLAAENLRILNEANEEYLSHLDELNKVKLQGYKFGAGRADIKKQSLADMLGKISERQGWSLYDAEGVLDFKAIEAYYDTFKDSLTRKQRKLVEGLIESGNAYTDAAAQQAEYVTSLFSNAADDIATKMVDAFIESGDAATDLGEIVSNVAREMAIDLVKAMYLTPILDKYAQQLEDISLDEGLTQEERTLKSLEAFNRAVSEIESQAGLMNVTLEKLLPYMETQEEEGATTLGDGIKGITEDTAGLLASYINAMRADLSAVRQLQAQHLPLISQSMPTIMDHLARIQANTLNIASSNQFMLNEIISMNERFGDIIDSGNNGSAIKVLM